MHGNMNEQFQLYRLMGPVGGQITEMLKNVEIPWKTPSQKFSNFSCAFFWTFHETGAVVRS